MKEQVEMFNIPFSGGSDASPVAWCLALVLEVAEPLISGRMQVDVRALVQLTW